MIKLRIGATEYPVDASKEVDQVWIRRALTEASRSGDTCIRIGIETDSVNVGLATSSCPPARGRSRHPNEDEQRVFDLWNRCGMNEPQPTVDGLIGFLNQMGSL